MWRHVASRMRRAKGESGSDEDTKNNGFFFFSYHGDTDHVRVSELGRFHLRSGGIYPQIPCTLTWSFSRLSARLTCWSTWAELVPISMFRGTTRTMELSKPCPQKLPSTSLCSVHFLHNSVHGEHPRISLRDTASQVDHSTSSACHIDTSQESPTCTRAHQTAEIWTKTTLGPSLRHHHIPWALRLLCTFSRSVMICGTP